MCCVNDIIFPKEVPYFTTKFILVSSTCWKDCVTVLSLCLSLGLLHLVLHVSDYVLFWSVLYTGALVRQYRSGGPDERHLTALPRHGGKMREALCKLWKVTLKLGSVNFITKPIFYNNELTSIFNIFHGLPSFCVIWSLIQSLFHVGSNRQFNRFWHHDELNTIIQSIIWLLLWVGMGVIFFIRKSSLEPVATN